MGKLRHMEGRQRGSTRRHNCEADSNKRLVSHDWDGDEIVTTYRCRRCDRTREERKTTAEIEAGLRAQTQRQIDEQLRGGVW